MIKAGWKSSEFWYAVAMTIGSTTASIMGIVPPKYAAIIGMISSFGYSIARGLAKLNGQESIEK